MAATDAATLVAASAPSAPPPDERPLRPRLSAALLLCRFGTIAALLLAAASFPQSSFFTIQDIRVDGARQISAAEVVTRTALRIGDPVSAVPPAEIARRLAAHPRIQAVDVRVAPMGRVTIRITERTAAAAIRYGGRFVTVDPAGIAIDERDDAGGLPVIATDGADPPWMRLGTAVPSPTVLASIEALAQLPAEIPRAGLQLRRSPIGDLSLVTADGIMVRLGRLRGLRERAAALPQILTTIRFRRLAVEYLDLRFTGSIILKPAGGGGGAGVRP